MKFLRRILFVALASLLACPAQAELVNINMSYDSTVTASQQGAFEQAATVWEGILHEYTDPNVFGSVDVSVSIPFIDGAGGILGSAGPTSSLSSGGFTYASTGVMSFDSADVANLVSNGTFSDVILHELAHVMGSGTLWEDNGVYINDSGQYTGAHGLAAWQSEIVGQGSATFVPVELEGGAGTANGHWDEGLFGTPSGNIVASGPNAGRDFQGALMTGWLNSGNGGPFISNTTKEMFRDLGYNVSAVPEPSSALLLLVGLSCGLAGRRRK